MAIQNFQDFYESEQLTEISTGYGEKGNLGGAAKAVVGGAAGLVGKAIATLKQGKPVKLTTNMIKEFPMNFVKVNTTTFASTARAFSDDLKRNKTESVVAGIFPGMIPGKDADGKMKMTIDPAVEKDLVKWAHEDYVDEVDESTIYEAGNVPLNAAQKKKAKDAAKVLKAKQEANKAKQETPVETQTETNIQQGKPGKVYIDDVTGNLNTPIGDLVVDTKAGESIVQKGKDFIFKIGSKIVSTYNSITGEWDKGEPPKPLVQDDKTEIPATTQNPTDQPKGTKVTNVMIFKMKGDKSIKIDSGIGNLLQSPMIVFITFATFDDKTKTNKMTYVITANKLGAQYISTLFGLDFKNAIKSVETISNRNAASKAKLELAMKNNPKVIEDAKTNATKNAKKVADQVAKNVKTGKSKNYRAPTEVEYKNHAIDQGARNMLSLYGDDIDATKLLKVMDAMNADLVSKDLVPLFYYDEVTGNEYGGDVNDYKNLQDLVTSSANDNETLTKIMIYIFTDSLEFYKALKKLNMDTKPTPTPAQ